MQFVRDVTNDEDYVLGLKIQKGLETQAFESVVFGRNERGNQFFTNASTITQERCRRSLAAPVICHAGNRIPVQRCARCLLAKQEITEVLYRYCRGCDRVDEEPCESCFHPGSLHFHGGFEGRSEDFVGLALAIVGPLRSSTHMVSMC